MGPSSKMHAIGLTNITHLQPRPWVSRPPARTPNAEARPPTAPQTPQGRVSVLALPEGGGQDRQCRRQGQRRAQPLGEAGSNQHAGTASETTNERRDSDDDHAGHQDPPAAQQVRSPATEEHEPAVGQ
jgi:hypothetical protein